MKDPFEAAYEEEDSPPASPPPLLEEEAPTMEGEDEEVAPGLQPSAAAPSNVVNASTAPIGGKGKEDEEEEEEENMDVELRKFSSAGDPDKMAKMQEILSQFCGEQMSRYESFRRSGFQKSVMRRLLAAITGSQKISVPMTIVVSGIAKMFVGELVETDFKDKLRRRAWSSALLLPLCFRYLWLDHYNNLTADAGIVVEELRSRGYEPYAYKWDRSHKARQLQDIYAHLGNGEECKEDSVSVAGRVIASRKFGKLAFYTLRDDSGTVQLYFEKGSLPEDQFELIKAYIDIGDILGACGSIKKTDKGELSVFVKFAKLLTKSLLPLPDKYHGLADVDKRYRQRYVDMIANPDVANTFRMRAEIVSEIRKTMDSWGFIEVETPVLQGAAGGAEARPFITYHNSLERNLYLRIATELHLKRMLVGGFEKVFEIGRIFRNEGISTRHNPEFTTIEMYEALSDYQSMMDKAEEIITRCALRVHGKLKIDYLGTEICFERPWRRETMHNLVKEATGVNFGEFKNDLNAAKEVARNILKATEEDYDALVQACPSVGHVLNEVFEIIVEPKLLQPTFVLDYPVEISPLAKPHRWCPGLVERFELFIYGRELANSFSELTDPVDQKLRLLGQIEQHNEKRAAFANQKRANDDYSYDVSLDEDFITALEYGMPPASGMGLGIDRLVMLLTNSASIRDVIAFPVLKIQQ